jgi:hypothetical protein
MGLKIPLKYAIDTPVIIIYKFNISIFFLNINLTVLITIFIIDYEFFYIFEMFSLFLRVLYLYKISVYLSLRGIRIVKNPNVGKIMMIPIITKNNTPEVY